jgi:hypothetical protein
MVEQQLELVVAVEPVVIVQVLVVKLLVVVRRQSLLY